MLTRLIFKFAQVRVRYAPSPTGMLHLGNLRTALFNYLFAKQNNGKFILRIQDTDQKRIVKGAVENIYNTLKWVGIQIDESPLKPGDYGPYVQSERKNIYKKYVDFLKSQKGLIYQCYCQNQNEEQKQSQQKKKCECQTMDQNTANFLSQNGNKAALKLKILKKPIKFKDAVFGPLQYPEQSMQDFVVLKKDGLPTYHFANVVDDIQMKITHVLRGQQWLTSTPKHIQLYQLFNHTPPLFVHLPNINGSNGKKLSKRDKANSVTFYEQKRYQPQAIINAIVLLGWVPSTPNKQFFSIDELIKEFKLQNIQKSPAQLDLNKLDFFNKHYMKQNYIARDLNDEYKLNNFKQFMKRDLSQYSNEQLFEMSDIILKRIKNHKDTQKFSYLYQKPIIKSNDGKGLKDKNFTLSEDQLKNKINILIKKLNNQNDLEKSKQFQEQDFHIIRHCITGQSSGPNAIKIIKVLGIPEVISRLKQYIQSN